MEESRINPSYLDEVEPLLRDNKGDCTMLLEKFPYFDHEAPPEDLYKLMIEARPNRTTEYILAGVDKMFALREKEERDEEMEEIEVAYSEEIEVEEIEVEEIEDYQRSYLYFACLFGDVFCAQGLIACGANILEENHHGETSLYYTVVHPKMTPLVEKYLSLAEDTARIINWQGSNDQTMLARAVVYSDNIEVIKLLVRLGTDLTLVDVCGHTPVQLARENDNTQVHQFLERGDHVAKNEWRPWNHRRHPPQFRVVMRTLLMLART